MRLLDSGFEPVLGECARDSRHQIIAIGGVIDMLELAPAALGEMAARRHLVMWPGHDRPVVEQRIARRRERGVAAACRDPVTARRNPDDQLIHR